MKKFFVSPEIEVEKMTVEDIITTSNESEEGWGGGRG